MYIYFINYLHPNDLKNYRFLFQSSPFLYDL